MSGRHVFGAWEGECRNDPHLASAPLSCGTPAPAPRQELERGAAARNLLPARAPRGAPRGLGLRERAVRQRHRVAARHQSAAARPRPAPRGRARPRLAGRRTAVEGISSSTTPVRVCWHNVRSRSGWRQQVASGRSRQLGPPRPAPAAGGGCGQRLVVRSRPRWSCKRGHGFEPWRLLSDSAGEGGIRAASRREPRGTWLEVKGSQVHPGQHGLFRFQGHLVRGSATPRMPPSPR